MFTKLNQSLVFRLCVMVFALGLSVWFFVSHGVNLLADAVLGYAPEPDRLGPYMILAGVQVVLTFTPAALAWVYFCNHPKVLSITTDRQ